MRCDSEVFGGLVGGERRRGLLSTGFRIVHGECLRLLSVTERENFDAELRKARFTEGTNYVPVKEFGLSDDASRLKSRIRYRCAGKSGYVRVYRAQGEIVTTEVESEGVQL